MNICAKFEHFKKSQGNLEFHQNKCHLGDVLDTKRQCAKATNQWAQRVAGRPNPMAVGQLLCRFGPRLLGHVSTREGNGYGDGESQWRLNKLASRPTATWQVTASAKSVELPYCPINIPYQ
jgi:hypothetical protein